MHIRQTIYSVQGQPITLAFVPGIEGHHPELIDAPPPEPKPLASSTRQGGAKN
jgi:hypothetical protein